jgi:flagellar motor switch protein FliG
MSIARGGGRAAVVLAALLIATAARAAEQGDRLGTVVAARIDMQRQLGEWLTRSLQGPAEPYRVEVAVRLELRGIVREVRAKQETATPAVKIGGRNKVKLPGLGMVEGGAQGGALMPEINIEGETRVTEQVTRSIETEVVRLGVLLFVDSAMPKDRRDQLVKLVADLAGVDRARGDDVQVMERALAPAASASGATVVTATIAPPPQAAAAIVAICLSAIVAAAILAWGIGRRAAARGAGAAGGEGAGEEAAARPPLAAAEIAAAQAEQQRRRRAGGGPFRSLADATPAELVQVIADVDTPTAIAIVDLFGLGPEEARLVEATIAPERRLEIGLGLASSRVVPREDLAELEERATRALALVRSRVSLGGPARLAEFLSLAPAAVRKQVLDGVAARDEGLARAARAAMLLFDDLPKVNDVAIRRVVAAVDPAVLALALVGAPEVRERVLGVVSERLRAILEAEEEVAQGLPGQQVEAARAAVEDAMRALKARGELPLRAAPPDAAAA